MMLLRADDEGRHGLREEMKREKREENKSIFGKQRASIILNSRSPCNHIIFDDSSSAILIFSSIYSILYTI